jgi:hypothetical protein
VVVAHAAEHSTEGVCGLGVCVVVAGLAGVHLGPCWWWR